jgi:hypothetical protein
MSEKKIFVYSTDSAIAIVEGVYNYQDSTIKVQSKKNYLKSKFFENHSKILEHLFSNSAGYQGAVLRTNLLPESDIYKLFFESACKASNTSIQAKYQLNIETLKQTYLQLIDSNFKGIFYQDKVTQKRILAELNQKTFAEISDYSFLFFYHTSVPQDIPVYQPSFQQQWESKQAQQRNSVEPIFGGALTNRGLRDIFL